MSKTLIEDLQTEYNSNKDDTKYSYYTQMPSKLASNKSPTDSEYRVLSVLIGFFNQEGETFASNRMLAEATNKGERTIIRALQNMRKRGYIEIEYIRKGKEIIRRFIRPTELLTVIKDKTKMSRGTDKNGFDSGVKSGRDNKNSINKNKEYI